MGQMSPLLNHQLTYGLSIRIMEEEEEEEEEEIIQTQKIILLLTIVIILYIYPITFL